MIPRLGVALPAERQAALNDDMVALIHRFDRNAGKGPVAIAADYLETVIVKNGRFPARRG